VPNNPNIPNIPNNPKQLAKSNKPDNLNKRNNPKNPHIPHIPNAPNDPNKVVKRKLVQMTQRRDEQEDLAYAGECKLKSVSTELFTREVSFLPPLTQAMTTPRTPLRTNLIHLLYLVGGVREP
jgi:hypothetical protein